MPLTPGEERELRELENDIESIKRRLELLEKGGPPSLTSFSGNAMARQTDLDDIGDVKTGLDF